MGVGTDRGWARVLPIGSLILSVGLAPLMSCGAAAQAARDVQRNSNRAEEDKTLDAAQGRSASTCAMPADPKSRDRLTILATKCCIATPPTDRNCLHFSQKDQFVIIKDGGARKPYGYLLVPSVPVAGIEATKQTEADPVAEFWQYGWQEAMHGYLKKPSQYMALAINSEKGRDQDQLHIHISCVHQSVADRLAKAGPISRDPAKPSVVSLGAHENQYEVITLASLTGDNSPFRVLTRFPHASRYIGDQSIAIIGTGKNPPFYMAVTYYVDGKNPGTAEELLDQTDGCGRMG
ncbi:MAG: CDP-diacylglycerol diphosphatase [Proteobacteria bacterium]|nr:CDP-diacylglycerol diphosphatase [Pseudomonadota bacterium]